MEGVVGLDAGGMRVAYAPGHTPGHCALYFPEAGLPVAADAQVADEAGQATSVDLPVAGGGSIASFKNSHNRNYTSRVRRRHRYARGPIRADSGRGGRSVGGLYGVPRASDRRAMHPHRDPP